MTRVVMAATMIATALPLCSCEVGDRIYSARIEFKAPTQDLETAKNLLLSAAAPAGYRKGGQWIADGKRYSEYSDLCHRSPECIAEFDRTSYWMESPDIVSQNSIYFELTKISKYKYTELETYVNINKGYDCTNITITFQELGGMDNWVMRDFSDLRRALVEKFGDRVQFSTDFNPWIPDLPTRIGTEK